MEQPDTASPTAGSPPSTSLSQRHPRACRQCASTKIKCTWRASTEDGDPCDRCRRLGKDCIQQTPSGQPRKKRTKTTRVAQLERKLDGLISLIGQQSQENRDTQMTTPPTSTASDATPDVSQTTAQTSNPYSKAHEFIDPETDALFEHYRREMQPNFPFVFVPPDEEPEEFRMKNPFLFRQIVIIANYKDVKIQRQQLEAHFTEITNRLMLRNEKSLDLLQSLLCLVAFYLNFLYARPQLTNLLHICSALIVDLGLNRPPQTRERGAITHFATRQMHGELANRTHHSFNEKRALLGCFYLHSVTARSYRTMDEPRFTAYMEDCCQSLLSNMDSDNSADKHLVTLVRIQRALEEIDQESMWSGSTKSSVDMRAPLGFYVRDIAAKLHDLRSSLPPFTQPHEGAFHVAALVAEVHLYEYAYYASLGDLSRHTPHPSVPKPSDYLYRCLTAISKLASTHFEIEPKAYYNMSFIHWGHVAEMLIVLSRLFITETERWSREGMEQVVDAVGVMQGVITRLGRAKHDAGITQNDIFFYVERRVLMFKTWLEGKPATSVPGLSCVSTPQGANTEAGRSTDSTSNNGHLQTPSLGASSGGMHPAIAGLPNTDWGSTSDVMPNMLPNLIHGGSFTGAGPFFDDAVFAQMFGIDSIDAPSGNWSVPEGGGGGFYPNSTIPHVT